VKDQLVARVELPILDDAEELGFPRGQRQPIFFVVLYEEHTRQAVIHLRPRAHVRMRVIPVRPRAVGHFELVHVLASVTDGQTWVAIGALGHVETMPVDDRVLGELVGEAHTHLLTTAQADHGAKIGTGKCLNRVRGSFEQAA
jgi:hypothetical protein